MRRVLLLSFLVLFISGCSVVQKQNSVKLHKQRLVFEKPFEIRASHECLNDSFAIFEDHKIYGKLFMEYIDLDSLCTYNGAIYSFFTYQFKSELKLKSMKLVEQVGFDNISFYTFKINDDSYVSMIFQYSATEDLMIVDYKGKLSNELIKSYQPNYKSKYLHKKRFDRKYNRSLARMNYFNSYFHKDVERRIPR